MAEEADLSRPQLVSDASISADETVSTKPTLATARDEDMDTTNPEAAIQARPEWGSVAMLAAAASLGASVPGAISSAYAELFRSVELNGEFSMSNGGGPIGQLTKEEIVAKKQEEAGDGWTEWARDMEERREEQERRERDEWSRTPHSFAGVEMTGQEWGELSQAVGKGGAMHQMLIDRLMKNGKNRKDAEAKANEIAEIYKLMSKPKAQRTPEEQAKIDKAETDPEFRDATRYLAEQKAKGVTTTNELEKTATGADQHTSVMAGADAFDVETPPSRKAVSQITAAASVSGSGAEFRSAPDLQAHHEAALAATEPLDAPKSPQQVAAIAPTPAPGGGFEV